MLQPRALQEVMAVLDLLWSFHHPGYPAVKRLFKNGRIKKVVIGNGAVIHIHGDLEW